MPSQPPPKPSVVDTICWADGRSISSSHVERFGDLGPVVAAVATDPVSESLRASLLTLPDGTDTFSSHPGAT